MRSRLVLGCGTIGHRIVERLPRTDDLLVIDDDAGTVETLRESDIRAEQGDPTDPEVLNAVTEPAVVLIAGDRTDRNRLALEHAANRFPGASLVVYAGGNPTGENRRLIDALGDYVIDPTMATAAEIVDRAVSPTAQNALGLRQQLAQIDGRLAVVAHDNPDPDAIASAVALVDIANHVGVDAEACYFGEISHQENRAMVNLLELRLRNLEPGDSLEEYDAFALVDHSRPGVNDQLPEELAIDIVIDHHPPRGPVPGMFVDIHANVGATSTVLAEYLERFGVDIDPQTATALFYGIRVDTKDFTREVSAMDFTAAAILLPYVDTNRLRQIEAPTVGGETLDTVARAIKNRTRRGSVVAASAGRITDRDALPQAADQLLAIEGVDTVLVFGLLDGQVFVSARSRASAIDLGETLRDAYDQIGSAGGHADMAGAQLEVGILAGTDDERADSLLSVVEEVITDRFFEAIQTRPGTSVGAYSRTSEWLFSPDEDDTGGPSE